MKKDLKCRTKIFDSLLLMRECPLKAFKPIYDLT